MTPGLLKPQSLTSDPLFRIELGVLVVGGRGLVIKNKGMMMVILLLLLLHHDDSQELLLQHSKLGGSYIFKCTN